MLKGTHVRHVCLLLWKGGESVAKKRQSISGELRKIVRKNVSAPYIERLGVLSEEVSNMSVLRAIALAQVKKGLDGDLKATELIEEMLTSEEELLPEQEQTPEIVVRVVSSENGN